MNKKKKLGIIGGMGSRAGVNFLQKIINYSPAISDQEFLEIIYHNNSIIPDRTKAIVYNEASPLPEILNSVKLLADVEVIVMTCITSYYYYHQIKTFTRSNLINPLHLIKNHLKKEYKKVNKVGVLATTGTIESKLFHTELAAIGIQVITLNDYDQEHLFMKAVYMNGGLKSSIICDEAFRLMNMAFYQISLLGVDIIIGGCTEMSAVIKPVDIIVPYIDLLDLLAKKTVEICYELKPA